MQLQMHATESAGFALLINEDHLSYATADAYIQSQIAQSVTLIAELIVLIRSVKNNWFAQLHVQAADGLRNITRMATEIMSSKCD
mmetsp:Transcript_17789/g.50648  ORF Transcript_17789/g.50648 Transcript_17789/m.50648 type:complete len:85 (-) Transcript_17789:67-321(-)